MLNLNKLYTIDCLDGMRQLDNETAQIIIVDPPYNIGKDFGNNKDKKPINDYLFWCDQWIKECERILMPNGTMFIYGFSEILCHIFVRIDLNKRWLVWYYLNKNTSSQDFWQRSHESIICCWKKNKIFNTDLIREPYTEEFLSGSSGRTRPETKGRLSKGGKRTLYAAHPDGALPRDVIMIPALAGSVGASEKWFICKTCNDAFPHYDYKNHKDHNTEKHPTQKPLDLCNKLILSARQEKGFILIPFVGSGSECVSAKSLGLDFIGFDINPEYIHLASKRLENTYTHKEGRRRDNLVIY